MTRQDIVFASHAMPERIFSEETTRIKWFSLFNYDLETTTQVIKDAIADQSVEKNIVISVYQKYVVFLSNEAIEEQLADIIQVYRKQSANRIMFASCLFLPYQSKDWNQVAKLNDVMRIYNIGMGRTPLNLHKMGLTTISETDYSLRTKGGCYADFQLGLGVGKYYSLELLIRIKQHLLTVFDNAFTGRKEPQGAMLKSVRVKTPPPLAATPGYMGNPFFKQQLQDLGLISSPANENEDQRLDFSEWRPTGWRHWDLYRYLDLNTKEEREEALEHHLSEILQSSERPVWGCNDTDRNDLVVEFDNDFVNNKDQSSSSSSEDEGEAGNDEIAAEVRTVTMQESEDEAAPEAEKEKPKKENYNENNQLLIEYKRAAEVNEELVGQYKQELGVYKVQATREKAAAKEWRKQAETALADNKELSKLAANLDKKIAVLEDQIRRMRKEYKFLRGLYENGGRQRVTGQRYAKYEDFLEDEDVAGNKE